MQTMTVRSAVAFIGVGLVFAFHGTCQAACSQRYEQRLFTAIDTLRDIPYGKNADVNGLMDTLKCDIYLPYADTSHHRPLLVLTHGGSFTSGDKTEPDIVRLCIAFASRGYVTASINYRLGLTTFSGSEMARANIRAVQDERAAVRYFRSRADSLRIDTALIFAGGTSAGAFTAIQHAYLDQSEIPASMDTSGVGGLEGASGTPGYSSHIRGVINLWGAIGDTAWINTGDIPIVSIHGTADNTVPYNAGWVFGVQGFYWVYGSASIHQRAVGRGVYSVLRLFPGMGHQFPVASPQMDTAEEVISGFLGSVINCDSGITGVARAAADRRGAVSSGWIVAKSGKTCALAPGLASEKVKFYDSRGGIVDMRIKRLSGATAAFSGMAGPGLYFAVDGDKNHPPLPLRIYR